MKRLLHIEWLKVSSYRSFYVFTGIYAVLIFFTYFGVNSFLNLGPLFDVNSVYKFPNVWYFVSYVSSWFSPILSLLMILLVCNEFAFRTLRQHIIDGLSREELLTSKLLMAAILSVYAGCLALISGLLFGLTKGGIPTSADFFSETTYLLRTIWSSFGMMTAAILIALLVRRSALSVLVFILFYWIIEPLVGRIWLNEIYPYFPLNRLDEFISSPINMESIKFGKQTTPIGVTIAGIIYPIIFVLASLQYIRKKDL
jgi:ABC-type transport system involved in multi-copper enzyme maturation permease subunit